MADASCAPFLGPILEVARACRRQRCHDILRPWVVVRSSDLALHPFSTLFKGRADRRERMPFQKMHLPSVRVFIIDQRVLFLYGFFVFQPEWSSCLLDSSTHAGYFNVDYRLFSPLSVI